MRGSLLRLLLISALAIILVALPSCIPITEPKGEADPCEDEDCRVNQLILNTGYNQSDNTLYSPVQPDPYWELVNSPTGTDNTQAYVINKYSAWDILPNSRWISAYEYEDFNENNEPPEEPYTFNRCFCVCERTEITINLDFLADDWAEVYLDSTFLGESVYPVGSTANVTIWNTREPKHIEQTMVIEDGTHCIRVNLHNLHQVAMGLNISGNITTEEGDLFLKDSCCNPTGAIIGRKINDINNNGQDDNNADHPDIEPGLEGWTIVATYTDNETGEAFTFTTTTDIHGNYCFNNLPPGEYTVYEVLQPGDWSQTFPQSSNYTDTLGIGEVLQLDFGNFKPCAIIDNEVINCGEPGAAGPTYTYTFDVTNISGATAYYMLLTPPEGNLTITPDSPIPLDPPLADNATTTVTATLTGAQPGDCFTLTLIDFDPLSPADGYCIDCCCSIKVCPQLPYCGGSCVSFYEENVELVPGTFATFEYTFCIGISSPPQYPQDTVNHIYLYLPPGVTMQSSLTSLSNYIPVSISVGDVFCDTVIITGATPGTQLQFGISLHDETLDNCCVASHTINLTH